MERKTTAERIIQVSQELAQLNGYHGFSYNDVAERVGIRTASIHHHFRKKEDLGRAMVEQYRRSLTMLLAQIDAEVGEAERKRGERTGDRLRRYADIFEQTLSTGNRMCLGGMLATEYTSLPRIVQREVGRFIAENERWLTRVLAEGRDSGALSFSGTSEQAARTLFSTMEGAMLTARGAADRERFRQASAWILGSLEAGQPET